MILVRGRHFNRRLRSNQGAVVVEEAKLDIRSLAVEHQVRVSLVLVAEHYDDKPAHTGHAVGASVDSHREGVCLGRDIGIGGGFEIIATPARAGDAHRISAPNRQARRPVAVLRRIGRGPGFRRIGRLRLPFKCRLRRKCAKRHACRRNCDRSLQNARNCHVDISTEVSCPLLGFLTF